MSEPTLIPGFVADDRHPGYVFPSWREALIDAQKGIDAAYERRQRMFRAANKAGLSLKTIGEVVGLSATGVHKIVGRTTAARDSEALLDAPVGRALGENTADTGGQHGDE